MLTVHTAVINEVIAHANDHEKFSTPEIWFHQVHRTAGVPIPTFQPKGGLYWVNLLFDELDSATLPHRNPTAGPISRPIGFPKSCSRGASGTPT